MPGPNLPQQFGAIPMVGTCLCASLLGVTLGSHFSSPGDFCLSSGVPSSPAASLVALLWVLSRSLTALLYCGAQTRTENPQQC